MAESSTSASSGDVEWVPGPAGGRLLRVPSATGDRPVLLVRGPGGEVRVESRPGPVAEFEVPDSLDWSAAWLLWPDGTRVAVAAPRGRVIELRPRRARSLPEPPDPRPPAWTTPPFAAAPDDAADGWRARRAELERELAAASAAIARARESERVARDAVVAALGAARADLRAVRAAREADASAYAVLSDELSAERAAHAVTRGSLGTLADALAAARAERAAARDAAAAAEAAGEQARAELAAAEDARANVASARAEAASLRAALGTERAARQAAEAELRELQDRAGLLQRVAELDREAAGVRELERRAREQAEAAASAARRPPEEARRLLADLDAAAAALRAATARREETAAVAASSAGAARDTAVGDAAEDARDTAVPAAAGDAAEAPRNAARSSTGDAAEIRRDDTAPGGPDEAAPSSAALGPADPAPASTALVRAGDEPRLRRALVALAREDAEAAGLLLAGLLPAQGAILDTGIAYDLTLRGIGTFAITVEEESARVVRLARRRARGDALFHLAGDPPAIAELLAGDRRKLTRFRRNARVTGRRRRARELHKLPTSTLSLAEAVRAGARLEPALVYRALPFAVEPSWTRGYRFTVAQRIAGDCWHVTARDGLPLHIVALTADAPADATVTMSRAAFDRLLADEPHPFGDRPAIRGDREAVAALKRWTDAARGV